MKTIIKNISLIVFGIAMIISSCTDEETLNPQISILDPADSTLADATGYPDDLIFVQGMELSNIKSIVFVAGDVEVPVVFSPTLNSDKMIMFNVPFDETLGSVFGMQEVVLTNKQGKSVSHAFEILQPEPEITGFNPERPKAGNSTIISGNWFQNLTSVTFAGNSVEYSQLSSSEIYIELPDGAVPDSVEVTTTVGSVKEYLDVDLGFNIILYNDFDGGGLFANNMNWSTNGDLAANPVTFPDVNGIDGNYIEIVWDGSTASGWGNCHPNTNGNPGIEETDPANVIFVFDIYCVSSENARVEIQIDDLSGANWALASEGFTADQVGKWVTIEMPTVDFKTNYGGGEATGDMDLQNITTIKIAVPEWTGADTPVVLRIDNMRFWEYY